MVERDVVKIDQCLFGYADGHRLLASSLRLAGDIASDLTASSDIVPGTRFAGGDGYWTGFPVPRLSRYGLMRTWPAPEMRRPGCVWTHLLLFDPALFEMVDDLSCFEALARRPAALDDRAGYARTLTLPSLDATAISEKTPDHDRGRVAEILGVLYGGLDGPVETSRPGELDSLVLAVWSQQWPKLRRNFRFQTAATTNAESASKRFDLQLRIARPPLRNFIVLPGKDAMWLEVASDDIRGLSDREFRAFLRRYGQDVKRQRGSFRPLAEMFAVSTAAGGASGLDVSASLARWFPEPDDAATLKRDLMDGVILPDAQVEAVLYLCEMDKGRSLPAPSETGLRNLLVNWHARSFDLMRLAEWAATEQGDLADVLLSTVAKVVPSDEFWSTTEGFPEMRRRMVANQPDLLDAEPIGSLKTEALLALLDAVPAGRDVGKALVRRLPSPVDKRLVKKATERFPAGVLSEAIERANALGVEGARDWFREIATVSSTVLDPVVMEKVRRSSIVVAIAEALKWLSDEVERHGLPPWTAGLADAQDDLGQTDRDRLEAFLLALALSGGDQAQAVFERSFGYLHGRIVDSYLSYQAERILQPKLPSLGWRNWDDGLKLRFAVTRAYVRYGLDPESFGRLLRIKRERKMLRRAAEEVDGGDRFADVLRD